jgi:hypothetical protein
MKTISLFVMILLGCIGVFAQNVTKQIYGKPIDGNRNFNPIIPDFVADPSVVMFNGVFYLYGTTDINQGLAKMGIPVVWKSKDFVNWSFEGNLVPSIDWSKPYQYIDAKGKERIGYFRYWAPGKPVFRDGKFYLFPTIVKPDESLGTYVMVANHPEGPFEFTNGTGVYFNEPDKIASEAKPMIDDIDGEPFIDNDGSAYIYWRRRKAAQMNDDFSALIGEKIDVPTSYGGYSEGPLLFKRDSLYYYIYTLSGNANYCNGYMISKKSPLGPFEAPPGDAIFVYSDIEKAVWGPGHGNVFQMPGTDNYYFLYLEYGEGSTTRQVFVNKMKFGSDGSILHQELNFDGVGYLQKSNEPRNLILGAAVTASSVMPEKEVKTSIIAQPNGQKNLKVNATNGTPIARYFSYVPSNIADESNGTCWRAAVTDSMPTVTIDLKKAYKISKVEIAFTYPTAGHAWVLEKSMNGKKWKACAKQDEVKVCSPHVADINTKARYLKLSILKGEAGIWEMKVY